MNGFGVTIGMMRYVGKDMRALCDHVLAIAPPEYRTYVGQYLAPILEGRKQWPNGSYEYADGLTLCLFRVELIQ